MDLPREAIRPEGSNCFSRVVSTRIFKKNLKPLVIFHGGPDPLPPSESAYEANKLY